MSLSRKTKAWLKKNVPLSLQGKRVLITGANSGIGLKTAETVLYLGGSVVMACRNAQKAEKARESLLQDYPGADIRVVPLDMSDFRSIEAFAAHLPKADVFVNNAGVFHRPGETTPDGFDLVMGTNYLGVYYLSELILPKLLASGREITYVNTTSIVHKVARIDYDRFEDSRGAYFRSKLCVTRYTKALADRTAGTNVRVFMTHPGIAITPIARHALPFLYRFAALAPFNSPEKSALSLAWLLSHRVPEGSIVGPGRGFGIWGYPTLNKPVKRALRGVEELVAFTEKEIKKGLYETCSYGQFCEIVATECGK